MKKTLVTVGLAALSASSLHAQMASDLTPAEQSKLWSLSATLRGFYDDNVTTLPRSIPPSGGTVFSTAKSSFGLEVSPSIGLNHSADNTSISAGYVYDLKKYFDTLHFTDQTHEFRAKFHHEFSERYKLTLSDSFVIAQEPTVLDPTITSSPLRTAGSNMRNLANLMFTAELTKLTTFEFDYSNTMYAYKQKAGDVGTPSGLVVTSLTPPITPIISGPSGGVSRSALLDRMEHLIGFNWLWHATENTTARVGYQLGIVDYTSPEVIIWNAPNVLAPPATASAVATSNVRNQYTHTVYIGVDHNFTPELTASVRVGVEDVDYYHAPSPENRSTLSPYADARVTWQYKEGSYAQFGVKHLHNSTDIVGLIGTDPVMDEESTAVYLTGTHQIIPKFNVGWIGQYQHSTFVGGGVGLDGKADNFYIAKINLAYQINPYVSAETGYEFDHLGSDLGNRSYSRNQVYIGVRASY